MRGVEMGATAQRLYLVTRVLAVVALLMLGTFGNVANAARGDDQAGGKPSNSDGVTVNNDTGLAGGKEKENPSQGDPQGEGKQEDQGEKVTAPGFPDPGGRTLHGDPHPDLGLTNPVYQTQGEEKKEDQGEKPDKVGGNQNTGGSNPSGGGTGGGSSDGNGANVPGPYDPTGEGSDQPGNGGGNAGGMPDAGTVGNADDKNPPGQQPGGSDPNQGYECDGQLGVGNGNPAHTGCGSGGEEPVEEEPVEEEPVEEEPVEEEPVEEEPVEEEPVEEEPVEEEPVEEEPVEEEPVEEEPADDPADDPADESSDDELALVTSEEEEHAVLSGSPTGDRQASLAGPSASALNPSGAPAVSTSGSEMAFAGTSGVGGKASAPSGSTGKSGKLPDTGGLSLLVPIAALLLTGAGILGLVVRRQLNS